MKDVKDTWCIQIEVTNKCELHCSNCTHLVDYAKKWEMDIETFQKAVNSLKDWPKMVGVIGGNPVLHSRYLELVDYMVKNLPRERRGMWVSNWGKNGMYKDLIQKEFSYVNYNPHAEQCEHQPILCASQDLVPDENVRREFISRCWVADIWSPSITPKGAYRCEVMGCMDMAINLNLGLPIEPGWWQRPLADFQGQLDAFCHMCSACIPMKGRNDMDYVDDVSPSNMDKFKLHFKKSQNVISELRPEDKHLMDKKRCSWQPEKYLVRMRK